MNMEVLPSGSYRVIKIINKKRYSLTFNHKPTQREVYQALEEKSKKNSSNVKHIVFHEAAAEYVDLKKNVLSASTIKEYTRTVGRLPEWFVYYDIADIDQIVMQRLVNEMAQTLSAKTVKNRHSFCVGVIRLFYPQSTFATTLPKKVVVEPYIPSEEDVKTILEYSKGGRYEIVLRLACYGLRRSEICALEVSDLSDDNFITIDKALVQDKSKNWVIKSTKTTTSVRTIAIDDALADMIRELDTVRVFNGYPGSISNYLSKIQNKLNMQHFSLHKFRHYFCTILSSNGVSENDICALGGWKQGGSSNVMKQVYRHSHIEREKERQRNIATLISKSSQ